MKNTLRRRNCTRLLVLNAASIVSLAWVLNPVVAFAQDKEQQPTIDAKEQALQSAAEDDAGTITITGSRIRLPNYDSAREPTVTIASEYIINRNLTNVADAINELPGFRGSVTPAGVQGGFGQGVNFLNNLGLGSNRTLTLVNGRRVVSSNTPATFSQAGGGTQVDLNIIPAILIDRIDAVSVGGAPVYGSDAIAGTVNLILRDKYEGAEFRATSGLTEQGDNFTYNFSGVVGKAFAGGRGHFAIGASYDDVKGVVANQRGFLRDNIGAAQNPNAGFGPAGRTPQNDGRLNTGIGFDPNTPNDGVPGRVLIRNFTFPDDTRGGRLVEADLQFAPNGNIIPFVTGIPFPDFSASGGDGFRFSDFTPITSNLRRFSTVAFFNYDVTNKINFFAEGLYYNARADQLVAQPTFNTSVFGGLDGSLTFSANNPFLNAQARGVLAANGLTEFNLSRHNIDLADNSGFNQTELYRGVVGFKGDFNVGSRSFNWEVSGNYGRTQGTDFTQDINAQNFINAINVAQGPNGTIVCSTNPIVQASADAPIADAACVPINLFGFGAPSQAARNYVIAENTARTIITQYVINANVGGKIVELPGGPLAFNVGYEHRDERASFVPNDFQLIGLGRSAPINSVRGGYNLDEIFGELNAPLISPSANFLIDRLEIFARGRYVNNTINGNFFSWAAGGSISPIRDITFRGNFTRSFRSPSVTELFQPISPGFSSVPDLCSTSNRNAGPVPTIRNRNCTAFLAVFPTATPLIASTLTVPSVSGGNPNLQNEVSNSFTFGVILKPRFISRLNIAVDYISIDISAPIASLSVNNIVSGCFDNDSFNASDPANGNSFCSQIRRTATGQVVADSSNPGVRSGFVNGQRSLFNGIQATLDYNVALSGLGVPGKISLGGDLLYVRTRIVDNTGVAPARSDGTQGDPQWSGQARFVYSDKGWGFSAITNYVGKQLISRFNRGPSPNSLREFDSVDAYATVNANIYVETSDKFRLNFSVTNLFNRVGQRYFGATIFANDQLGRRFAISATKSF
ncbi:MAG: TonB-dependent receptor domain-containing protein [Sphingomonas sp.]